MEGAVSASVMHQKDDKWGITALPNTPYAIRLS